MPSLNYGRTLHKEITPNEVVAIISEHYARKGMDVTNVAVDDDGTTRIYRKVDVKVDLPDPPVATTEGNRVPLFIRDALQLFAYHCFRASKRIDRYINEGN